MWLGATGNGSDMVFAVPPGSDIDEKDRQKAARLGYVGDFTRLGNSCWFTNFDHGKRHQPLNLMTMEDNRKFNKKIQKNPDAYESFENYNAIEVPNTDAIPVDFNGIMGVPISFLDKYSPEQFEIIWQASGNTRASAPTDILAELGYVIHPDDRGGCSIVNGRRTYDRIFIRHKNPIL